MDMIALPRVGDEVTRNLLEIRGAANACATTLRIVRREETLELHIDAADPDMLELIATVSPVGTDGFLYDEDCVQLATVHRDDAAAREMIIINARGSRKGSAAAQDWPVECRLHETGWRMRIDVPLPAGADAIGLSVHRFFRGVDHEVHSLNDALPHPLDITRCLVVVLNDDDADAVAATFVRSITDARAEALNATLAAVRAQMHAADVGGPRADLATAQRFAETALTVEVGTGRGCWNELHLPSVLLNRWELDGDRRWLDALVPRIETIWSRRADRTGEVDVNSRKVQATWYETIESGGAICLTTGVTLGAIARFMRMVHEDRAPAEYRAAIEPWKKLMRESIAVHDYEWQELPGGQGMYIEPYLKGPRRMYPGTQRYNGSRICPLNRAFFLAMPMLNMAHVLGDDHYRHRVERMARYFRANCDNTAHGGLTWEYHIGRYPSEGEDLSHAACQWMFAEMCMRDGIVWTEADLKRIVTTLDRDVFRHGDVPCGTVRGYWPGLCFEIAAWSTACRYAPHLLAKIVRVLETAMHVGRFDFQRQGWGVRLLTLVEKARRLVQT